MAVFGKKRCFCRHSDTHANRGISVRSSANEATDSDHMSHSPGANAALLPTEPTPGTHSARMMSHFQLPRTLKPTKSALFVTILLLTLTFPASLYSSDISIEYSLWFFRLSARNFQVPTSDLRYPLTFGRCLLAVLSLVCV